MKEETKSTFDKLNEVVKKIEEMDELANEFDKIEEGKTIQDRIREKCLNKVAFDTAEELGELVDDLTDEDFAEISTAFDELEEEIEDHEKKIEEMSQRLVEDDPQLIRLLNELAKLYHVATRYDEEIQVRKRMLRILDNGTQPKAYVTLTLKELIIALICGDYITESNLTRQRLFSMYKAEFKDDSAEDIDMLIDIMQSMFSAVEYLEVKEEYDKAEETYNKMINLDLSILDQKVYKPTAVSLSKILVNTLYEMDLQPEAERLLIEFPKLKR